MTKRIILVALLALLVAAGYRRLRSPRVTVENQIRRLLAKAEQGAENRSVAACMSCVSRDYSDSLGNTYHTLRQLAARGFYSIDDLDATVYVRELTVRGDKARVVARVSLNAVQRDQPETTATSDLIVHLVREQKGWRRQWKVIRVAGWNFPEVQPY